MAVVEEGDGGLSEYGVAPAGAEGDSEAPNGHRLARVAKRGAEHRRQLSDHEVRLVRLEEWRKTQESKGRDKANWKRDLGLAAIGAIATLLGVVLNHLLG